MANLTKMPTYPEWRDNAELVFETHGPNKGAIHVRLVDSGQVLCGFSGVLARQREMPMSRDALPPMHIACLGRVPR